MQLLWDKGSAFEKEVIDGLESPFTNVSKFRGDEKKYMTENQDKRLDPGVHRPMIY
ncbi:MAG: hypothetical protein AB1499_08335 [Nitrospirota bacterium]